jgi:divalent metal cation (Fe/Co/Zn/Cd) transporter
MTVTATSPETTADPRRRRALVRRGAWLGVATIAYNAVEAVLSLAAGAAAGSVALVGFGVDSVIELSAGGAALWRLRADGDPARRERVERMAHRVVGACFLALAAYVAVDAAHSLWARDEPRESPLGIAIAAASVVIMPLLARAKRRVARGLSSGALAAEATQTALCSYLSAILLGGLALNAGLGWWWADPVAALAMVPIIVREGVEGLRGRDACGGACAAGGAGTGGGDCRG